MTKSFAAKTLRVVAVVALASCFGESTGPDMGYARLSIVPQFDLQGLRAVDVNRVRVLITRPGGTPVLKDTIVDFPANLDTLDFSLGVVIQGSQEDLELSLFLLDDPGGVVVFQSGPDLFTAVSGSGGASNPVTPVPLYVGTGSNAVGVRFLTTAMAVTFGDSVLFTAEAFDAANATVAGAPIIWSSSDTTRAVVRSDTIGRFVAKLARGNVTVTASLLRTSLTTPPASVTSQLAVQPLPSAIVIQGGGGQTGAVGQPLSQPVRVRINAADNLGVAGVRVNFAVTSGGGSLSAPADTTDATGDATVTWILGPPIGSQSISATLASLPAATISVPATGVAGPASQLAFTSVPASATAGAAITPPIQVTARDQFGNTTSSFTGNVTIALAANPGAATLSGTATVAAVAGVATFTGLSLDNIATGYTFGATATGLTAATSGALNVVPPANVNAWLNTAGGNWSTAANWSLGTVPSATDTVAIKQSGTYSVNLDVNATVARLDVGGASGLQTLQVNANTLTMSGNGAFSTRGRLTVGGGTVTGPGTLDIAGGFDWTGGSLDGSGGAGIIRVAAGGTLAIGGSATKTLNTNYVLEVAGAGTWSGTGQINSGNGAVLRVPTGATFDVQAPLAFLFNLGGTTSRLDIQGGTVSRTGGAGVAVVPAITNNGTVNVQAGELHLSNGGTTNGTFNVAAGATLRFDGGAHQLNASSQVAGAGTVQMGGATTAVDGAWSVTGTTEVLAGTHNFNTGGAKSTTNLNVSSGSMGGSGLLTVSGAMSWTGGALAGGTGSTRVLGGASLAIGGTATKTLNTNYTLELAGTGTWTGTGGMNSGNSAVLRVLAGGTLDLQANITLSFNLGGSISQFQNQGTVNRTIGTGVFATTAFFVNGGAVSGQSGTLDLSGGGNSTGSFTAAAGGVIEFGGGIHTLSAASSVAGAGTLRFAGSGGVVNMAGGYAVTGLTEVTAGTFNYNGGATGGTGNLTVSGGTLGGTGLLTVSGAMSWTGGSLAGATGTTRVLGGGTLAISGTATKTLNTGYALELAGTGTWTGTGGMNSGNGAVIRVLAGGVFDLQADIQVSFNLGGGISRFHNQGTVNRTVGTGAFVFTTLFDNDGAVSAQTGTLDLSGGGTSIGSFTASAGAVLEFGGGTHDVGAASSVAGGGTVRVSGGTAQFTGTYALTGAALTDVTTGTAAFSSAVTMSTPNLTLATGGTLGGNALFTVSGAFTWNGGSLAGGTGTTRVLASGTLTIGTTATKTLNTGYTLENAGSATWSAGSFNTGSGAILRNLASGTFSIAIAAAASMNFNLGGAAPSFENAGSLTRTGGAGVATLDAPFVNTGSITISADTVRISGGGSLGSNLTLTSPGVLDVTTGTYTLIPGMAVAGTGVFRLNGATLTVAAATDSVTISNFRIDNGTVNGAGIVRLVNSFTWNGGTLGGTATTRILGTATASLAGGVKTLNGGHLLENGNLINWTAGQMNSGNGSVLRNLAGRTITTSGTFSMFYNLGGAPCVLDNLGTLQVTTGALTVDCQFNTSSPVTVSGGNLALSGGGTLAGAVTLASTRSLDFSSGSFTWSPTMAITGAGDVLVSGATVTVPVAAAPSVDRLRLSAGTIDGQGALGIVNLFDWTGGTLTGAGSTNVTGPATLTLAGGTKTLNTGHTLNHSGTGTWSAGQINSGNGAMFRVMSTGTLTWTATTSFLDNLGGAQPSFINEGNLIINTGGPANGAGVTGLYVDTASVGLNVTTGTLQLSGGARLGGTKQIAGGQFIETSGGTTSLKGGFVANSPGNFRLNGGTLTVDSALTATIVNFDLLSGTADHEGLLVITGTMVWSGGTLSSNTVGLGGMTRINAGAQLAIQTTGTKTYNGTHELDNQGTVNFGGTGNINTGNGAVLRNAQTWNWTGDGSILDNLGGATPVFRNLVTGSVTRNTGSGVVQLQSSLENSGAISVSTGTLRLSGGSGIPFTGTVNQSGSGTFDVGGGTFTQNGPFSVTGSMNISGGAWQPAGNAFSVSSNLNLIGGALNMTNAADSVDINGSLTIGGPAGTLNAGVIRISGSFNQNPGGTFQATAQSAAVAHRVVFDGPTFTSSISFADPVNSFFRRLVLQRGAGTSTQLQTDVRTTFFSMAGGTHSMTGAGPTPLRRLIADTVAGASSGSVSMVSPMVLVVNAALVDSNVINVDTVVFAGNGQGIATNTAGFGNYIYQNIRVAQTGGTPATIVNMTVPQDLIVSSGTLDLTGRIINVSGDFRTENTGVLRMTAATDSLKVVGDATFSGGSTNGTLTSGVITVNGNFDQAGSTTAYFPTVGQTHRLNMSGTAAQTISFAAPTSSHFDVLRVIANSRNVTFLTDAEITDSLHILAGSTNYDVLGPTARVQVDGLLRMEIQTGSPRLAVRLLELSTTPQIVSTVGRGMAADTTAYLTAAITTLPIGNNILYNSIRVNTGAALTMANDTIAGDLELASGTATFSGATTFQIGGQLRSRATGAFSQTNAGSRVTVLGNATFAGATSTAINNGILHLQGNFSQGGGSTNAFQASGAHTTLLSYGPGALRRSVSFANPGTAAGDSRFGRLQIGRTIGATSQPVSVELLSNVQAGQVFDTSTIAGLDTVFTTVGNAAILTADTVQVSNVNYTTTRLVMGRAATGGTFLHQMATVTMSSMDVTQMFVTIHRSPGAPGMQLNSINFASTPTGAGRYFLANTSGAGGAPPITLQASNVTAAAGCPFVSRTGPTPPTFTWIATVC